VVTLPDGTIACAISGVCIRVSSYGVEYELYSRQGFSAAEVVSMHDVSGSRKRHHDAAAVGSRSHASQVTAEQTRVACKPAGPPPPADEINHNSLTLMRGVFHISNITAVVVKLLRLAYENGEIRDHKIQVCVFVYAHTDLNADRPLNVQDYSDKRNVILQETIQRLKSKQEGAVCLLSVAASIEHACRARGVGDPFQVMQEMPSKADLKVLYSWLHEYLWFLRHLTHTENHQPGDTLHLQTPGPAQVQQSQQVQEQLHQLDHPGNPVSVHQRIVHQEPDCPSILSHPQEHPTP